MALLAASAASCLDWAKEYGLRAWGLGLRV